LKQYENEQIKIITDIKGKKWRERIKWDLFDLKNWSKKNNLKADLIISFQNTGCRYFQEIPQIIYLHQSLSFYSEIKWNFFKKEERIYWFYQNIYKKIIFYSLPKNYLLVVQTKSMKERVQKQFQLEDNKIIVIRPSFENIKVEEISLINFNDKKFHIFYPATTYIYKNHEIIIKALKYIKDKEPNIFNNLTIHFTFDNNGKRNLDLIQLMNQLEVESAIKLEGKLPYDKVLSFYQSCHLVVFPSYIESHPMPLIEAALFGLPLLVSDLDFSREVIGDYRGAKFLNYKDYQEWGKEIIQCYETHPHFPPYEVNVLNGWSQFFDLINSFFFQL
jgi:glycosyltransferase involved in cell wall biosynthesis